MLTWWFAAFPHLSNHPAQMLVVTTVLVLAAGIVAQLVAVRLSVPGIILLLLTGVCLGPDGLGVLQPAVFGSGLRAITSLCVAIIVFEGALQIDLHHLREVKRAVGGLVGVGYLTSTALLTVIVGRIMAMPWPVALLFAAIASVTGPTVVGPIVRRLTLSQRLRTTLEGEAIFADAAGVIAAATVFNFMTVWHGKFWLGAVLTAQHLLIGAAVGIGLSLAVRAGLRRLLPLPGEQVRLAVLGTALLVYAVAELLAHETGILAVAIAGIVFGSRPLPYLQTLRQLKGDLSLLCISFIFISLAAEVRISSVLALGPAGLAVVLLAIGVVRPLAVAMGTLGSDLAWREKAFVGLFAPRGVVAASTASYFTFELAAWDVHGWAQLPALAFLLVLVTVVVEGLSAPMLAGALGLLEQPVLVLGGDKRARRIAEAYLAQRLPVLMLTDVQDHLHTLLERGLPARACHLEVEALARHIKRGVRGVVITQADDAQRLPLAAALRHRFADLDVRLSEPDDGGAPDFRSFTTGPLPASANSTGSGASVEAVVMNPALVGRTLAEVDWPAGSLVVSIQRGEQTFVPRGETRLAAGDRATVTGIPAVVARTREWLENVGDAAQSTLGKHHTN